MESRKKHWEKVYATKQPLEFSWTQDYPKSSLEFIDAFHLSKSARIIDVGGGDSRLVDYLLDEGFENITVLDISEHALERARQRLGPKAERVTWIVSDIVDFQPSEKYDVLHDRAVFHFLTSEEEIAKYISIATNWVSMYITIATFSDRGPKKCSGLEVHQYSETGLETQFASGFRKLRCITEDHITPFGTEQNFLFCAFERKQFAVT